MLDLQKLDYNRKLLEALHSVFWYEGLLDSEPDEWVEFKKEDDKYPFSRPKYTDDCVIVRLIDDLRNKPTTINDHFEPSIENIYTLEDAELIEPKFSNYCVKAYTEDECAAFDKPAGSTHNISDGRYNCIWQMLVEMFGECGTSPRTGWIEKRKECADFLEQIMCIEELVYLGKVK